MTRISFRMFLKELRIAWLVATSFLIFGLIYGAFEIFEFTVNLPLDAKTMSYLHFSRGALTTLALLVWITWTLYEYRAKFQAVVRQHDNQFVRILDNISEAVIVTDSAHKITFWNKSATAMLGWKRDEVIGKPINRVVSIPLATYLVSRGSQEIEETIQDKTGTNRFVALTATNLLDENGKTETCTYLMRDLTEKAIRQAQMEHSERLASLGHMAAGIAHEIGNPLTAISSIIQLLQRRITDSKQLNQLQRVRDNIGRITKIVRDMIDFSRPASPELTAMNSNDTVRDALGLVRHDSRSRNIRFDVRLDESLPRIMAVPDQIYQVVLNLLINAADAVADKDEPVVRICTMTEPDGKTIVLKVTDNGTGIPENIRRQIFEPFFTTKQVGKGTGLGLSVSHHIITQLGGSIEVESVPGNTTFSISLPAIKDEKHAAIAV
jgi:PAS domain S-box-containing protein